MYSGAGMPGQGSVAGGSGAVDGTAPDARPPWQVWVDTGGTFTDCLGIDPAGRMHRAKVLSSSALRGRVVAVTGPNSITVAPNWRLPRDFFAGCRFALLGRADAGIEVVGWEPAGGELVLGRSLPPSVTAGVAFEVRSPDEAPVLGARLLTGTPHGRHLPAMAMRLATTRGTNALLQRRGAPLALFITRGFADLLLIGTQQRPELFALVVERPAPLFAAVVEVDERLAADGAVLQAVNLDALQPAADGLLAAGIRCAAVALMHSYRNPTHERRVATRLRELGFSHVAESAALAPFIRLLPRAETAVVDATLAPVVADYLKRVAAPLGSGPLHVMTSAGGLVRASEFNPKDSLLSGPAGGVVGAAYAGRRSRRTRVISFDMGGTSTDVARVDGDYEYVFEQRVGDAHLVAPALAIESVAAGGGSICRFDGRRLLVGPDSAGAEPGPACYGAGGPLTVTDVNLLLGRLDPQRFEIPIAPGASEKAAKELVREVGGGSREAILEGLLEIANERMADAIRRISLRRGYDPADYALVAFGGAGGQHACAVARLLGITTVLIPGDAGLLSALGLGHAVVERFAERQVLTRLSAVAGELGAAFAELAAQATAAVISEGVAPDEVVVRRRLMNLRFLGQDSTIAIEHDPTASVAEQFTSAYRSLYGYGPEGREVEVESLRVVASSRPRLPAYDHDATVARRVLGEGSRRCWVGGAWSPVPIFDRAGLEPGAVFGGPALVLERHSASVVEPGWEASIDGAGSLVLTTGPRGGRPARG
jgi:5-oxoprolinase (ATP-hydrolysing)